MSDIMKDTLGSIKAGAGMKAMEEHDMKDANCNCWKKGDDPPKANPGKWSPEVVAITNYGNVSFLCYFGTKEDGLWQRPTRFKKGEIVEWWIDTPAGL